MSVTQFVDHDDKVEENSLDNAFRLTAQAWQNRFGVPYSTCGCAHTEQSLLKMDITRIDIKKIKSLLKKKSGGGEEEAWLDDDERDAS